MRLFQLAYICRVYGGLTGFDADYLTFLDKTAGKPDFREPVHMEALLTWLRKWGCRQFAIEHHKQASKSILGWAEQWESRLPETSITLERLSDEDIQVVGDAYDDLSQRRASQRTRNGNRYDVRVGPTGAAKILFAARPLAFPPWDDPFRVKSGYDGSPRSYREYLAEVREQIKQLCSEAAKAGIPAGHIPVEVGRPRSTLPKLIDEYNWVTVTRGFLPPEPVEIAKWHRWSSPS
jgi:hypothetical protein